MKRSDDGWWQAIAGGGEDDETPLDAARRETCEEAGIPPTAELIQLDTVEPVPVAEFRNSQIWGENVYVIPQYCYGVNAQDFQIVISGEHAEYRWLPYAEARDLIKFEGNKTALWELNQRLKGKGPRG